MSGASLPAPPVARRCAAAHQRLRKEQELVVEARQPAYPRTDGPYRPVLAGLAAEAPSQPNQAAAHAKGDADMPSQAMQDVIDALRDRQKASASQARGSLTKQSIDSGERQSSDAF